MVPARPERCPGPQEDLSRRPGPAARAGRDLLKAVPAEPEVGAARPGAAGLARRTSRRNSSGSSSRRSGPSEQRAALKGLKCPLYPYQREGVERFLRGRPAPAGRRHGAGQDRPGDRLLRHPLAHRPGPPRADHRPGQPQAAVGPRMGRLLRPADPGRRRLARRAPGALRRDARKASSSSITSNCSATWRSSAAGTPTWSCSTRRSGSRTGRPRRRSRSRG